jgi:hypothetical protein
VRRIENGGKNKSKRDEEVKKDFTLKKQNLRVAASDMQKGELRRGEGR